MIAFLCAVAIVTSIVAVVNQRSVCKRMTEMQNTFRTESAMYKVTTWTSGGIEVIVRTPRESNSETEKEWQARHDAMVAKIQTVAPED